MKPLLWWFTVVLATIGCDAEAPSEPDGSIGGGGDGLHRIDVPQPTTTDAVWIYAASPSTPGPHPVVVYAHGQGVSTVANCWPDGPPAYGDVTTAKQVVDDLAQAGYLGVAVYFRNTGDGAPSGNKPRDHHVLDTRTLLAAAQWARTQHGEGSAQVAFMGVSMGTFPTFLAATRRPELYMRYALCAARAMRNEKRSHHDEGAGPLSSGHGTEHRCVWHQCCFS